MSDCEVCGHPTYHYASCGVYRRITPPEAARPALPSWSDTTLATALIVRLCQWYDAGGISHGRSWESEIAETARDLLRSSRPAGDIATWPADEPMVREARDRVKRLNADEREVMLAESEAARPTARFRDGTPFNAKDEYLEERIAADEAARPALGETRCECGHTSDEHGNDGTGHCGATRACRSSEKGCKQFRQAAQPLAPAPKDVARLIQAARSWQCRDGVTHGWSDCSGCAMRALADALEALTRKEN